MMTGESQAWLIGQSGEQLVSCTGWIGEHPGDGGEVAHLLLYPTGTGIADKMRTLAVGIGLVRTDSGTMPKINPAKATAWLDTDSHIHLSGPGNEFLDRPVDGGWWLAAQSRGWIILTAGIDELHLRDLGDVDPYLARAHRLYTGMVTVTDGLTNSADSQATG